MRNTSYRRRSGLKVLGSITDAGYGKAPRVPQAPPMVVPEGTPNSVVCDDCGTRVMMLASGRPRGHAAGGYRQNIMRGIAKCSASGNEGQG